MPKHRPAPLDIASPALSSPCDVLRPWQFVLSPVHTDREEVIAYECLEWKSQRSERPALFPGKSNTFVPKSPKQRDRRLSLVYGCGASPVGVPYGNVASPKHYPRPKSAPITGRTDMSLPGSCTLLPLPPRIDAAVGGCTFPKRVPYGLVETHKQLVSSSRRRPSSAQSTSNRWSSASLPPAPSSPLKGLILRRTNALEDIVSGNTLNVDNAFSSDRARGPKSRAAVCRSQSGTGFQPKPIFEQKFQVFHPSLCISPLSSSPTLAMGLLRRTSSTSRPSSASEQRRYADLDEDEVYAHVDQDEEYGCESAILENWEDEDRRGDEFVSASRSCIIDMQHHRNASQSGKPRRCETVLDVRCRWLGLRGPRKSLEKYRPLLVKFL